MDLGLTGKRALVLSSSRGLGQGAVGKEAGPAPDGVTIGEGVATMRGSSAARTEAALWLDCHSRRPYVKLRHKG